MEQTLGIVAPVFAVMGFGWIFARRNLISEAGISGLVNLIFYLSIPAVIFRTLASGAVQQQFSPWLILAYFSAAVPHFAISWGIARRFFRHRPDTSAIAAMAATFSNLVLIGLPLVQRAYGDRGLVPLMLIVMLHSPILFTITTATVTVGRRNSAQQGLMRSLVGSLGAVLINPIVIGALGGLAYGMAGIPLPSVIDDTLALLGHAAAPVSLFAVGATLASCKIAGDLREAFVISVLKIAVLPALVWVMACFVFPVPQPWVTVALIAAAMPAGANAYVFARKYDCYVAQSTAVVVLSTAVSVVTLTVLIAILPPP